MSSGLPDRQSRAYFGDEPRDGVRNELHGLSRRATREQHKFLARFPRRPNSKSRILVHPGRAPSSTGFGTYIPAARYRPLAFWHDIFSRNAGGILRHVRLISRAARLWPHVRSLLALNIMPYISASIIIQLRPRCRRTLEALKKEGESGRKKLNQYTRYSTVVLAAVQAYGIGVGLEGMRSGVQSAVIDPGSSFPARHGGDVDRRYGLPDGLGEQITRARRRQRHFADHLRRYRRQPAARFGRDLGTWPHRRPVAGLHPAVPGGLDRRGRLSSMERAQRRILVQYPKRQVGNRMFGGEP